MRHDNTKNITWSTTEEQTEYATKWTTGDSWITTKNAIMRANTEDATWVITNDIILSLLERFLP